MSITPSKVTILSEYEATRYEGSSPYIGLLIFTTAVPDTPECGRLVGELEGAARAARAARAALREVDSIDETYLRKVREEANAAAEEGRAPKAVKAPDTDDMRLKRQSTYDALVRRLRRARTDLEARMRADAPGEAKRSAEKVPALHERTLTAAAELREAFGALHQARENSIDQLAGNPDVAVRQMPSTLTIERLLDGIDEWLAEANEALADPFIDVSQMQPPRNERAAMARSNEPEVMARLHAIEMSEGWAVTSYLQGWRPPMFGEMSKPGAVPPADTGGESTDYRHLFE